MSDQQLDAQGEAQEALGEAIKSYGLSVLGNPRILGNFVTDMLPDLPRERSLLITAAEADVAGELTRHVEEQHVNADTAVQMVARALSERTAIDPAASIWAAIQYARALGYPVRSDLPPQLQPQPQSAPQPTGPRFVPASPSVQPEAGVVEPPTMVAPSSGAQLPADAVPLPAWQTGYGGGSGTTPAAPRRRNRGPVIGAIAVAGVVVLYLVIAAVGHIAPFPKPHHHTAPIPAKKHVPHPSPHVSPSVSPTVALASNVAPLTQLLPGDLSDTTTECSTYKGPFDWSMPGLAQALTCTDPSLSGGYIYAYQMDSSTNYVTAWQNFNTYWKFDVSSAGTGTACPPTGSNDRGITPWHSSWFPYVNSQVLECAWVGANGTYNKPAYTYAYPTEDAFITVVAAPNSAFDALNTWWTTYSAPAASPSPSAP
jgi:hypothetical protein